MEKHISEPIDKQQRWDEVAQRVDQFRDRLGLPVDPDIKETVTALNALGFKTGQSCEGHFGRAQAAPWIHLGTEGANSLEQKAEIAFDEADKADREGKPEEELDRVWAKAHSLRQEARRPTLEEAKRLTGYLSNFYKDRQVPYDTRLTINSIGNSCRLESIGAFLQDITDPETKQQKLQEYREEMMAFTNFLKNEYFTS